MQHLQQTSLMLMIYSHHGNRSPEPTNA
ncbi:Protein of unknown function [Pyronema omphalodes CBS 100304]|uniref:Uncharacterized protein n=1 Tax=Pyronema omphalodes (strain CBS 100304) TaxID=1076935 RepID=U4LDU2_PYROM|nr:Protein of unknown function [Pyronema omphalodes CBS 100304]